MFRLRRRSAVVVLVVWLVAAASPAAAQVAFDGLFAGIDAGCGRTADFDAWQSGLVATHVPQNGIERQAFDPGPLAAGLGRETAIDKGEWVEIAVPLTGTFAGLPVSRFVFSIGKENGIYGYALEFAAPAATVRAALGERLKRSEAMLPKSEEGAETTTGFDVDRRVAIWCDFSN